MCLTKWTFPTFQFSYFSQTRKSFLDHMLNSKFILELPKFRVAWSEIAVFTFGILSFNIDQICNWLDQKQLRHWVVFEIWYHDLLSSWVWNIVHEPPFFVKKNICILLDWNRKSSYGDWWSTLKKSMATENWTYSVCLWIQQL